MASRNKLRLAVAAVALLQAGGAAALGLGDLRLESFLNEPLKARVSLLDVGNLYEDQIRIRLATAEDFDRLGVDRAYFLTGIKFEVQIDSSGRGSILLTTDDPVLEPYLDFIIEARWPDGRLLRNYTVLVDPPVFDRSAPQVSATARVAELEQGIVPESGEAVRETVDTGTRVGMRQSTLGPGEMPQRDFSAGTAGEPTPGARYMIRRDETLWTIAQRARLPGVSIQQTMLDIQRLNPDAFIDGNINRIKAGFIIYIPASSEITADVEAALAEVRQQNEDWRAGRPSAPAAAGPALRISAVETEATAAAPQPVAPAEAPPTAVLEDLARSEREREELGQRLAALAERLDTLERIVQIKDEQIATLQQALAEAASGAAAVPTAVAGTAVSSESPASALPPVQESPASTPPPASPPPPTGGFGSWLYGIGAALVLALLGLLFWRRRQAETAAPSSAASPADPAPVRVHTPERDVFADVRLQDVELDGDDSSDSAGLPAADSDRASAPGNGQSPATGQRGYGERKHDQYASDVETGDALAEADIYIAYGRYNQAMELLRNALRGEPGNNAYRLKLLELALDIGNRDEADLQLAEIQLSGDRPAIERAQALSTATPLAAGGGGNTSAAALTAEMPSAEGMVARTDLFEQVPAVERPDPASRAATGQPAAFTGFQSGTETSSVAAPLLTEEPASGALGHELPAQEPEFLGLEIEDESIEELDLSPEFESRQGRGDSSDDDFVFADDGDPLATKLDLARAYIDMGDEDGARQILEEVLAEGDANRQQEARELISKLG